MAVSVPTMAATQRRTVRVLRWVAAICMYLTGCGLLFVAALLGGFR